MNIEKKYKVTRQYEVKITWLAEIKPNDNFTEDELKSQVIYAAASAWDAGNLQGFISRWDDPDGEAWFDFSDHQPDAIAVASYEVVVRFAPLITNVTEEV